MNGNDDCTQMITKQSTDFTKGDRDFQPSINEHLDMLSPTDNDESIHCDNDSQISAAIDESVTDTETSESHANAKCPNHADCANPGMERRHSEKYDTTTPKRSVLKSRLANIIDRYGNQLMRYASANKQIVTGGIAGSTREK